MDHKASSFLFCIIADGVGEVVEAFETVGDGVAMGTGVFAPASGRRDQPACRVRREEAEIPAALYERRRARKGVVEDVRAVLITAPDAEKV